MDTTLTSRLNSPYTREQAAYPAQGLRTKKFWPSVGRLQESYGDLNLMCECPSPEQVAGLA